MKFFCFARQKKRWQLIFLPCKNLGFEISNLYFRVNRGTLARKAKFLDLRLQPDVVRVMLLVAHWISAKDIPYISRKPVGHIIPSILTIRKLPAKWDTIMTECRSQIHLNNYIKCDLEKICSEEDDGLYGLFSHHE